MRAILDTVLPFFALIFCGYAACRLHILDRATIIGLNAFVFWLALPVFLFELMTNAPAAEY